MKWFKHDADANRDAKLEKVLMRYGAEGYALYWLCLELIAAPIDKNNINFELEHDAEILAYRLKMDSAKVEEIMRYMIGLDLFELDTTTQRITCLKLANRLENSIVKNPQLQQIQQLIKTQEDEKSGKVPDNPGQSRKTPARSDTDTDTDTDTDLDPDQEKYMIRNGVLKPTKTITMQTYLNCLDHAKGKGETVKALPDGHAVFKYAQEIDLPMQFLWYCWREFVEKHKQKSKKYKDWPAAFYNCVRDNWYKLWYLDGDEYKLTTAGKMAEKKHKAAA